MDGAEHREVLERHLRRSVLADRHAGVRAGQAYAGPADRRHPHEVIGTGEERRERRRERPVATHLQADRRGDHLLLGDEHLEVALGVRLGEQLGERRVRNLAVERDDVGALGPERRERVAVGPPGRDLVVRAPARPLHAVTRVDLPRRTVAFGLCHLDAQRAHAAELLNRLLGVGQGLAVLALEILDLAGSLSLLGPGHDDGRAAFHVRRLRERTVDLLDVVTVDLDRVPAEGASTLGVGVEIPAVHRLARLAEAVHVDDRREVVEPVVSRVLERLPDRPLRHLAVAAQHPDAVRQMVESLAGERDADADRQALAERPGRDVHPRQHRCGVALEAAPELAEREQVLVGDRAGGLEEAVVQGRGVTLGEDQMVVAGVFGTSEVVVQVLGEQHGDEVGGGHRRRRMARPCGVACPDRVDAELLSELAPEGGIVHIAIVPPIGRGQHAAACQDRRRRTRGLSGPPTIACRADRRRYRRRSARSRATG